jgi:hypothetical protein
MFTVNGKEFVALTENWGEIHIGSGQLCEVRVTGVA